MNFFNTLMNHIKHRNLHHLSSSLYIIKSWIIITILMSSVIFISFVCSSVTANINFLWIDSNRNFCFIIWTCNNHFCSVSPTDFDLNFRKIISTSKVGSFCASSFPNVQLLINSTIVLFIVFHY